MPKSGKQGGDSKAGKVDYGFRPISTKGPKAPISPPVHDGSQMGKKIRKGNPY